MQDRVIGQRYAGVIVKCDDKVLLCRRSPDNSYSGTWSIPSGKVEDGEETMDAAKREFFEETSVDIDNENIRFVGLLPRYKDKGGKFAGFMYTYLLEVEHQIEPNLSLAVDGDEHDDCGYYGLEDIDGLDVDRYLMRILDAILL